MIALIKFEIKDFWHQQGLTDANLDLERSDLLSILIYITVQAQVDDLRC